MHISDFIADSFKLNKDKIKKIIALKLLDEIPSGFRLPEYVKVLKQAYELAIPAALQNDQISSAVEDEMN